MTQTKGPEFKGGINPMYNTLAVQAEAVADPDVYPDFLNTDPRPRSIVKPRDPKFAVSKEDMQIDPSFEHLKDKIDRRSKSTVTGGDPDFVNPNEEAYKASERAWEKYYGGKQKGENDEIPSSNPSLTGDAVAGSTGDAELDALIDSRYPVMANQVVAHEAQLDLTQQASVVQQLPAQR